MSAPEGRRGDQASAQFGWHLTAEHHGLWVEQPGQRIDQSVKRWLDAFQPGVYAGPVGVEARAQVFD